MKHLVTVLLIVDFLSQKKTLTETGAGGYTPFGLS